MGKIQEALNDCNQAIALDESYIKAYLRRAKCCTDLEKFEDAVRDYEKINKLEKNRGKFLHHLSFIIVNFIIRFDQSSCKMSRFNIFHDNFGFLSLLHQKFSYVDY